MICASQSAKRSKSVEWGINKWGFVFGRGTWDFCLWILRREGGCL